MSASRTISSIALALCFACSFQTEGSTGSDGSTSEETDANTSDSSGASSGTESAGSSSTVTGSSSTVTGSTGTGSSSGSEVLTTIEIEGWGQAQAECEESDRSCLARAACEAVTEETCIFDQWDCFEGDLGSWYPESLDVETLNFSLGELTTGYGNICACDSQILEDLGVAVLYTECGYGHWFVS